MKKQFVAAMILAMAISQGASALMCGAMTESQPNSGLYDKQLFFEKIEEGQSIHKFVKPNGEIVDLEDLAKNQRMQELDGAKILSFQFKDRLLWAVIGDAELTNNKTELKGKNYILANSKSSLTLSASGYNLYCTEEFK